MTLINIGYGNMVSGERILAIVTPESAPIKRIIGESRDRGELIDATMGKKTKTVIFMDSGHIILSAFPPESISEKTKKPNKK